MTIQICRQKPKLRYFNCKKSRQVDGNILFTPRSIKSTPWSFKTKIKTKIKVLIDYFLYVLKHPHILSLENHFCHFESKRLDLF